MCEILFFNFARITVGFILIYKSKHGYSGINNRF